MTISAADFEYIRQIVQDQSGVTLSADKSYLADLHLQAIAASAGFSSIAAFVAQLRSQPLNELHFQAIEALVTTETSFFRDRHPFDALRQVVLPELIAQHSRSRSLTIWCAACSTGQEPYSIAMLIREYFPMLEAWSVRLIASDFSRKVLSRAQQGRYTNLEVNRGLSDSLKQKYFQRQSNHWQIKSNIQQMVEFQNLNLLHSWDSIPKADIIFLRNTLIYFETATKQAILKKIRAQLNPNGYLFLGGGETTINLDRAFQRVQLNQAICYQIRSANLPAQK